MVFTSVFWHFVFVGGVLSVFDFFNLLLIIFSFYMTLFLFVVGFWAFKLLLGLCLGL